MEFFKGRPPLYPQYPSPACVCAWKLSCFTRVGLCDPTDCNLLGSYVHGILQARILEWAAVSSSRGFSQCRDWICCLLHCRQILYPLSHRKSPYPHHKACHRIMTHMFNELNRLRFQSWLHHDYITISRYELRKITSLCASISCENGDNNPSHWVSN